MIPASGLNPPTRGVIKYHIPYPGDLTTYWNIVPASGRIPCGRIPDIRIKYQSQGDLTTYWNIFPASGRIPRGRIPHIGCLTMSSGYDHLLGHCPSNWSSPRDMLKQPMFPIDTRGLHMRPFRVRTFSESRTLRWSRFRMISTDFGRKSQNCGIFPCHSQRPTLLWNFHS